MDKTREELIALCKQKGVKGYSGKKKEELVKLLEAPAPGPGAQPGAQPQALRMVDLFAGTGAFSLAFGASNAVTVSFANDMVKHSKEAYDANFGHKLTLGNLNDIKVEDIPPHDILTGGFPCQPFSIAGYQEAVSYTHLTLPTTERV